MSTYVIKPGKVNLFRVDKEGNDKRPDWSGKGKTLEGKDFEIALWDSQSQKGTNYLSGSVSEPYNPNSDAPMSGSFSDAPQF